MYWEDTYEMYEYASNLDALEKNEDMKFQYMLHAQTKEALRSWKDSPIPFPDISTSFIAQEQPMLEKKSAKISEQSLDLSPKFRRTFNAKPMSESQRVRRDYVRKRQQEHLEKMQRIYATR